MTSERGVILYHLSRVSVSVCVPALQPLCSWPEPVAAAAPPLRWSEVGPAPVLNQRWETWLTDTFRTDVIITATWDFVTYCL